MSDEDRKEPESGPEQGSPEGEEAAPAAEAPVPENGGGDTAVGSGPDSEPTPVEPADAEGEAPRPPAPMPTGWRLALQLLLPVAAVGGAIGLHWAINVPDEIVHSGKDQGAKDKKKKKAQRSRRDRDKRRKPNDEPRSEGELDKAWTRWHEREFDDEPVLARWARRHQAIISKVFVETRRAAFEGAEEPGVTLVRPKCRTIRCRYIVRSPYPHEIDRLDHAMRTLQLDGGDLWRMYASERIEPPEGQPEDHHFLQVTVAFQGDDPDPKAVEVGEVPGDSEEAENPSEPEPADESGSPP